MKLAPICVLLLTATPLLAQSAQFTLEMRDMNGEVITLLSEADDGFAIDMFDPDLIELSAQGWTMRWSGRFENEVSPENLDLVRNNTFIQFTHAEAGAVSCRPAEDSPQPNSWTRNINRDALKAGFLNMIISECQDELGAKTDVPGLPFNIQATYILEQ